MSAITFSYVVTKTEGPTVNVGETFRVKFIINSTATAPVLTNLTLSIAATSYATPTASQKINVPISGTLHPGGSVTSNEVDFKALQSQTVTGIVYDANRKPHIIKFDSPNEPFANLVLQASIPATAVAAGTTGIDINPASR